MKDLHFHLFIFLNCYHQCGLSAPIPAACFWSNQYEFLIFVVKLRSLCGLFLNLPSIWSAEKSPCHTKGKSRTQTNKQTQTYITQKNRKQSICEYTDWVCLITLVNYLTNNKWALTWSWLWPVVQEPKYEISCTINLVKLYFLFLKKAYYLKNASLQDFGLILERLHPSSCQENYNHHWLDKSK